MVFDFFKQRSDEGVQQLKILGDAAKQGKLGEGLLDVSRYAAETNAAFAKGLSLSRTRLLQNLELLLTGNSDDLIDELSNVLLQADLGTATTDEIVDEVKSLQQRGLTRDDLMSILRGKLVETLETSNGAIRFSDNSRTIPTVLFIMGANGMGKTTTIGKLAHRLKTEGNQTVLVAACDTFRAGAVEQLEQWADRAGVECYGPSDTKSTPSAVLYGALDYALEHDIDTVLVDTSGRLSNNYALTQELAKMKRVIQRRLTVSHDEWGKKLPNMDVPHETLLVLDAAQGRMALDSAQVWNKEIGLSGLILTKLDGSARGGSVVAVSRELNLPVKLIGVGEGIDDLRDFEPEAFVDGLLGIGKAGGKSSANEGALLNKRLVELRKDRDEATIAKKKQAVPAMATAGAASAAGELTFQEMDSSMPSPPQATSGQSKKPNRKKKKKKKGKR